MQSSDRKNIQSNHKSHRSVYNPTNHSRIKQEKSSEKTAGASSTERDHVNVFTDEDRSFVPFFVHKKKVKPQQMSDVGSYKELAKKRTSTIEENFAGGKWGEIPIARVLPDPPLYWRRERLEINSILDEGLNDSYSSTDVSFNDSFFWETLLSLNSESFNGNDSGYGYAN